MPPCDNDTKTNSSCQENNNKKSGGILREFNISRGRGIFETLPFSFFVSVL